jgi:hypothetical protein
MLNAFNGISQLHFYRTKNHPGVEALLDGGSGG